MPLYEYDCRGCGHRFEALVRDATAPVCPSCGSDALERVLSLFAVNSDTTRRSNLAAGKKHAAKEQKDKRIADQEYARHHRDH